MISEQGRAIASRCLCPPDSRYPFASMVGVAWLVVENL